ncbi:MAG: DUF192 domain-containing protein [Terracidiphilus sp.]
MNLSRWFFPELRSRLFGPHAPAAATPLVVRNVTRRTQLASRLELADSGPARAKGLLGRKGLAPGEGIWIVPCESVHTFGMQFPIDLVYVDRKHRIRKVRHSVPPWRLSACLSAHSVIELPAGTVRETHTENGDMLEFTPAARP